MSTVLETEPVAETPAPAMGHGETLAASVVILLVMTVAQRLIGFGRGILFCRWLDPEQLGQWDVAFGFLNLAASVAVLGLPGSFGRYIGYFRQRGQFASFLWRTSAVSVLVSIVTATIMIIQRDKFSWLVFGTEDQSTTIVYLAICVAIIILHNHLTALFIAVRRYRIVTTLQFFQSLGFAIVSLGLMMIWPAVCASVIIALVDLHRLLYPSRSAVPAVAGVNQYSTSYGVGQIVGSVVVMIAAGWLFVWGLHNVRSPRASSQSNRRPHRRAASVAMVTILVLFVGGGTVTVFVATGSSQSQSAWNTQKGVDAHAGFIDSCTASARGRVNCDCVFAHLTSVPPYDTPAGFLSLASVVDRFRQTGNRADFPVAVSQALAACTISGAAASPAA